MNPRPTVVANAATVGRVFWGDAHPGANTAEVVTPYKGTSLAL